MILFLFPLNSLAEFNWKRVGENTDGTVFYVDKNSLKKNGNRISKNETTC